MNISIATGPCFPVPALQGGAVARLWQGLAEQFAGQGHGVTILSRAYPGQLEREVINGVNYLRHGGFSQSRSVAVDLLKDLRYAVGATSMLPRADILVINDFWLPFFASLLRRDAGRVVINVNRVPKRQFFLYFGAARFAAASQAIYQAIASQNRVAASRTQVIPNPIDTQVFTPPAGGRRVKPDATVLYAGRVHPEKGVHLLIDAFAFLIQEFPEARLRIVGPFKESQGGGGHSYLESLRARSQGLNVEFAEPVFDVQRLAEAYRAADVFCYPSLAEKGESFGIAPLEAMATGLVPVVSALDCFRDFVVEDETGYFFDHRALNAAERLAEKLSSVIADPQRTGRMSRSAIQKAQQFSYQRVALTYLQDFAILLSRRDTQPGRGSHASI